jgi:branched-chain amino acid transport system ATP-binding protein
VNRPKPLILEGLRKSFGRLTAVNSLSLEIDSGERHAIVGPNGAGKTTLFNLISGVEPLTSGRILLFGKDVSRVPAYRRAAMGLARTFQIIHLFQPLTVFENLLLAIQARTPLRSSIHKSLSRYPEIVSPAEELLRAWNLEEKRDTLVGNLSYGVQRQIEVVMALANRPRLLLLDEPTAGLSPFETAEMTGFLGRLDGSITMLIIEHDMDVVYSLAQKVTVMHFGQTVAQGTPEEIKGNQRVMTIYLGGER